MSRLLGRDHLFYDDDGSLVLRARLTADSGALLVKALDEATGAFPQAFASTDASQADAFERLDAISNEQPETLSQRWADALGLFAESWLSHGDASLDGDRQQMVLHVDRETLSDSTAGRCEIEGGPSLAAETVRRLSCDASLLTIIEDESGRPLDVGRKTRSIPPAIRRALRSRDTGCRFPGCSHTRFLDGHHIRHWAHGGKRSSRTS